jgi:HK97 family phage portal protein
LTQAQRDQARELYSRIGDSGIGDGQWWLLEGGAEYKAIGLPPDDLQMLESRQFQVSEICRFFGVPTVMVDGNAGTTAAWPASYEQQQLQFLTHTLKPYLEEWEDKISYSLLTPQDRRTVFAEHNVEGLLRADSAGRANFYSQMVQNGLMTRNEVRMKENLPPIDGADELTAQVNLAPVDELQGATNVAEQNRQPT